MKVKSDKIETLKKLLPSKPVPGKMAIPQFFFLLDAADEHPIVLLNVLLIDGKSELYG